MKKLVTYLIAGLLMIPTTSTAFASTNTSLQDQVIETGKKYLGAPYQFGAKLGDTSRFDCSSFSAQIFAENGIILPRVSRDQAREGIAVSRSQLQKGDLVFYDTNYDGQINHLGVYIQSGQMIHASTSIGVSITDPFSSYWGPRFVTARRVITEPKTTIASQSSSTQAIHIVKSGDTLWVISRLYGVTVDQLMSWNSLTNSVLQIGQSLKVSAPPSSSTKTYVVKSGDTLWKIATNNGTTVDKLTQLNQLQSTVIYPGQILKVS